MSISVLRNDILIVYYSKNTCITLAYLDVRVLLRTPAARIAHSHQAC